MTSQASSVWVFIAQLGEHCSANAEATGSNPVEAPKNVFFGLFRNCLNTIAKIARKKGFSGLQRDSNPWPLRALQCSPS